MRRLSALRTAACTALWLCFMQGAAAQVSVVPAGGDGFKWQGIPAGESAGNLGAGLLYPAPNAAGLLVAVLTHMALVKGGQAAERNARQEVADKALDPFRPHLAGLQPLEVLQGAVAKSRPRAAVQVVPSAADVTTGLVVEVDPTFYVTQDQGHIVLDGLVSLYPAGRLKEEGTTQLVRVVSPALGAQGTTQAGVDDPGPALRRQVEALLAHSLDVALLERDGLALVDEPPRTHRYAFAGGEKMERGQAVARGCARVVIRTLRNWLMSVPVQPTEAAPACPDPYALQARP